MPNPGGANGREVKLYPPDDVLVKAFQGYARENSGAGLTQSQQSERLLSEFGLDIKKTALNKLRKGLNIPSVRKAAKSLHPTEIAQHVIDIKQNDALGLWGVNQVKGRLAMEDVLVPRDAVREALHANYDLEFDNRFVGKKKRQKHRTPLNAFGPWHQEHCDGHEKLGEQALDIGKGISLPIYGSKDQYSAWFHALVLMPNVRTKNAIAHYYLDLVEARNYRISLQLTTDMGSEVGDMLNIHERLRAHAAPDFVPPAFPFSVTLSSTDNTPIESFWRWLREGEGMSLRYTLETGATMGSFLPSDTLHVQTFYWIWVPFIQYRLDMFREYWNNHRIQRSKLKKNSSGHSPKTMMLNPKAGRITARDCSISVCPQLHNDLREIYGGVNARENAYRFVSQEFQSAADDVYWQMGRPEITLDSIWSIFSEVASRLEAMGVE
ncbi:hypothetical protein C8R46DRAFT_614344 [Mycena filopes]|nr:hypothetical protein C8R46DRAFT_614344 [Mycena filopes]